MARHGQAGDAARRAEVAAGLDIEKTGGKWYPTLATLPDGRVLALSGHPEIDDSRHNNNSLELYDPATGVWSIVGPSDYANIDLVDARRYEYPRLHVLPDGTVISMSPMSNGRLERWHPYADANDWDDVIDPPPEASTTTASHRTPRRSCCRCRRPMATGPGVMQIGGSMPFILDMGNVGRRMVGGDARHVRPSGEGRREPGPRKRRFRSFCRPARSSSRAG